MITLTKSGNAIVFTFDDNDHYLNDGKIEVPVNSLTLVTDDSQMATFRKSASNDIFISATYDELGMSKADLESWFKENAFDTGGVTEEWVEEYVSESISGKADTSAVTASINAAVSGKMDTSVFNTYSASTDARLSEDEEVTSAALNALSGALDDKADTTAVTASIAAAVSGKVNTTDFNTYSAATDNRLSEDEEVTAAALNALNEKKLDASAYTPTDLSNYYTKSETSGATEISTALASKADTATTYTKSQVDTAIATKQDTLVSGTNIKTINNESLLGSGNINIQGGGSNVIELTQAQYDALTDIDPDAFYIITDADGGVSESTFNTYSASTDARLSEDEEVTSAALNSLNDALSDKADTSAVTESINAAVSGKADTSAFTAHTADTTIHTTSVEKTSWNGAATNASNAITALGGLSLVQLTQAQYDALATKDASTLYIITGSN